MATVTLHHDSSKQFDAPVTGRQIAEAEGLPSGAVPLAAKVDGKLVDLDRPIEEGGSVRIVPKRDDDPDALYVLRHSAAHVMAEAICNLYPTARLAYGPPVEGGFYYDIELDQPLSSADFARIEAEMAKIVEADRPFTRYELDPEEGLAKLRAEGNPYKLDNAERSLEAEPSSPLSWYATGEPARDWEDLCRGPHVPSTGYVGAVKLTSVAASHWRGDVNAQPLQRVYGTAFSTREALDEDLRRREAARERDHRVIGQRLGLFTLDEQVGPGLALWKPRGARVRSILEDFLRARLLELGYEMVYTPHVGKVGLYETSGHYPYFAHGQFPPIRMQEDDTGAQEPYLLRPMNCPHHVKVYASEPRSYRDLPVRLAEFGTVYRYEQSGELSGLTRVRGMTQDDAHIFCTPDQVQDEVRATVELVQFVLETFGFDDVEIALSLRDPDEDRYAGDPATWERAERELREVLQDRGLAFEEQRGEANFYGPKIDFHVRDAIGRSWQLGTVQLDYNLPERFAIEYTGPDNQPHRPVMIHRAPFGSMERFMGILIEHYAGAFPLWLAPEQIRVLPVSEKFVDYGEKVLAALRAASGGPFRVSLDRSNQRVNAKIRAAQEMKIPYMLVVGGRDQSQGTVSVRDRARGDLGAVPLETFVEQATREVQTRGTERVTVE